MQDGFPQNYASPANFSTLLAETRYIPSNIPTGYVQSYHLDVQRQITPNTVATVSYVGEHGVHIWVLADLNQAAANAITATCNTTTTAGCLSLQARRPITTFTGIEESVPYGFLSYNGLQAKVEHRYSKGLYVLDSFTYSRAIDNASGHLDTPNGDNSRVNLANLNGERGESAYDQPLNNTISVLWDLPYGHGRMFGQSASPILQGILGGWQLSAINTDTSGQPVNLVYSETAAFDVSDLLAYRPNVSGNPVTPASERIKTATAVSNFLNSATVSVPTDPSHPYGNAGRNSLRDYTFNELDTGLHKGIRLWSDSSLLDLRFEAFNVLNKVNYEAPDSNRTDGGFRQHYSSFPSAPAATGGQDHLLTQSGGSLSREFLRAPRLFTGTRRPLLSQNENRTVA